MLNSHPPLIIIGMHRSGTSMVAHLLRELGIFAGRKLDPNHEAIFFQNLNDWLLQMAGANWTHPSSFQELLTHKLLRKQCETIIRIWLSTHVCVSYMGIWKFFRYHSIFNLPFPWYWKDPRSTITLPIWFNIFPQAKVLYLIRNGVDVANSLMKRSQKILKNSVNNPLFKKSIRKINISKYYKGWTKPLDPPNIIDSTRCLSLESAFDLWEEYMEIADHNLGNLPEKQKIIIQYEDFLVDSVKNLKKICRFIGLPVEVARIKDLCTKYIISNRAYAYKNNSQLKSFYHSICHRDFMRKYGY